MTTPTLQREGSRVGGLMTDRVALVGRTDQAGGFGFNLYTDEAMTNLAPSITYSDGTPAAGNNFQSTAYATGLQENTTYYWQAIASDSAGDPRTGNQVDGTGSLNTGSFRTLSTSARPWKVGLTGCTLGSQTGGPSLIYAQAVADSNKNIISYGLDAFFWIGDVYYSDIGTTRGDDPDVTPFTANSWYVMSNSLDDGSVDRFRTNFITTMDANAHKAAFVEGLNLTVGHVLANYPTYYMWDDHDRCYNDCGDLANSVGVGEANKITNGHQVGHECYMNLNKELVDQESGRDFATDCVAETTEPAEYYYVDMPPCRFIVLDVRDFRADIGDADTAAKTMLGTTQIAWAEDLITNNPQKYLVVVSPLMFDGDHGVWLNSSDSDCWKGYSFARDVLLNYIWDNGNPARTVIISADTHIGAVIRYDDSGKRQPIYEFSASNQWADSNHGWLTGVHDTAFRAGEAVSASKTGGKLMSCRLDEMNMTVVETDGNKMTVKLVETNPTTGTLAPQVVWQREYK